MLVDDPVSGSKDPAADGQLTIFASGRGEARPRVSPLFDALGRRTIWVGAVGYGTRLKLVAEHVAGLCGRGGRRLGGAGARVWVSGPSGVVDALEGNPLVSPWQEAKLQRIVRGEFSRRFALSLALKDVRLAEEAAGDRFASCRASRRSGSRPSISASVIKT